VRAKDAVTLEVPALLRQPAGDDDRDGGVRLGPHWARQLQQLGHRVFLLPPSLVSPYVVRNKTNRTDAKMCREIRELEASIRATEAQLERLAKDLPIVAQLRSIPGIGLLTATALVGFVGDVQRSRTPDASRATFLIGGRWPRP
jgi:transposase